MIQRQITTSIPITSLLSRDIELLIKSFDDRLARLARMIAEDARERVLLNSSTKPSPDGLANSLDVRAITGGHEVFTDKPYAVFVELGTARMAAEPFLQPAFDQALRILTDQYKDQNRAGGNP
ncbi:MULTISPECIES: hypothetical protein [Iodidimonas]|jgi:hypothetical protein|uniref:HK97 gp10 family phage protein n=1 Tax=Iodidimonas nitroreducens TaxID=1236968 RepID=A0A5A7NAC6_9PROT|nr:MULTISPECIES: hypothetical protein [Iodidimonas]GAK34418.1 hypothetical protein AQ1_02317 [alpha proteobacterium Q-1]GER05048.1 hypothetical protein JCM17846_27300 [Iodidimonas nitroreducens]